MRVAGFLKISQDVEEYVEAARTLALVRMNLLLEKWKEDQWCGSKGSLGRWPEKRVGLSITTQGLTMCKEVGFILRVKKL